MSSHEPDARVGVQARSELRDFLRTRSERRRIFPPALLVGLLAGLVAIAFRAALAGGDMLRDSLIRWAHGINGGLLAVIAFSVAGALAALVIVRKLVPESAGSGIPHLEAVLHRYRDLSWKRVLPAKFIGGTLAIGAGMALGREGPTVQMGGSIGAAVSQWLKRSKQEELILIAAGAGAGLAAAFNAPLAGLIFVLEELQRDFRPTVFGAAFVAAATADVVSRVFGGQLPVFTVPAYHTPPLAALPIFAILGIAAGLLGVLFNRNLVGSLNFFSRLKAGPGWLSVAFVGALVGLIAYAAPGIVGGGHGLAEDVLSVKGLITAIPILFLTRYLLTMLSYGSGAPGGIFAPLLTLGALLGLAIGLTAHRYFPQVAPEAGAFAVVGMAAYFTAIVRAPLTGIVLIGEMTSSYDQMLPLIVACFSAYVIAEAMGDLPIYEALLQRDLLRGGTEVNFDEPIIIEREVEPGSPFDGLKIRDLGLPSGVVLVEIRHGDHETVPRADVLLKAHDRVTALIAPDAEDGLELFSAGCEA